MFERVDKFMSCLCPYWVSDNVDMQEEPDVVVCRCRQTGDMIDQI